MNSILRGPWSHSRASACARALYMDKVLGAPREQRPERFLAIDRRDFGSCLHLGAEKMLNALVKFGFWPDPALVAQQCLVHEVRGIRPYFHLADAVGEIEARMRLFQERFRCDWDADPAQRNELVRAQTLGSEMKLAVDGQGRPCAFKTREEMIDDGDEVTETTVPCPEDGWRGIIDYAESIDEEELLIVDFKNRPALFSPGELRADEQLSGYVDLVRKHFPQYKRFRYGIYYFQFGYTQIADTTEEQLQANVARLHARANFKQTLTKEQIGPEPGFGKCQYCDWIASCEAGKSFIVGGQLAPTDADQARQLAAWVMVTKEKVKAADQALKMFAAEFGAITLDDKTQMGYSVNLEGEEYDKDMTLRILKQLIDQGQVKAKLSDYTSIKTTDVKDLAKRKDVYDALAPARSYKADMKFEFFRPAKREGVRAVKEGRAMVTHPEDDRKTKAKVKAGGRS